jgi:hypothetical protein
LAEVAVSEQMFEDILMLIARLRAARASVRGAGIEMRQIARERCALKKRKQRVSAPLGRETVASAAGSAHRGWSLSPPTTG